MSSLCEGDVGCGLLGMGGRVVSVGESLYEKYGSAIAILN